MTKDQEINDLPIELHENDVFIPKNAGAVLFTSDEGICICNAEYVKWLVENATPEQYDKWESSKK